MSVFVVLPQADFLDNGPLNGYLMLLLWLLIYLMYLNA